MNFFNKIKNFLVCVLSFTPFVSFAIEEVDTPSTGSGGLDNPLNVDTIPQLLDEILEIVAQIMLPILVLAIIYTGFLFVKAQGKDDELTKAKQALFWTIVGAIIVLGATLLSTAIEGTIDELTNTAMFFV